MLPMQPPHMIIISAIIALILCIAITAQLRERESAAERKQHYIPIEDVYATP